MPSRSSHGRALSPGASDELLGLFLTPDGKLPGFARRLDEFIEKSERRRLTAREGVELKVMLEYIDQKSILLLRRAVARKAQRGAAQGRGTRGSGVSIPA